MNNQSYTTTIEVDQLPETVFSHISNVSQWWSKDFEGHSSKPGDEFVIMHPGAHYSRQKVFEVIPNRKAVWLVTESHLDWLEGNKSEWTNTKMVFEITPVGDKTTLRFTHDGLVPNKECYIRCAQGWDTVIREWLCQLIAGTKHPGKMLSKFAYTSYIKTSPEHLWGALTAPDIIRQWWGGGINVQCDWKAGSQWAMIYEDGRAADTGEVLEIDPPRRMVIKWRNESRPELMAEGYTRCAFELEAVNEAVKLTVTHGADIPNSKFIETVANAWPVVLCNLKSLLETGEIVFKERTESYGRN